MADLASNTQYQTAGASNSSPAKKYPKLNINPGGYIRPYSPLVDEVRKIGNQAAISSPFQTGTIIAPPLDQKMSPVPTDYSSFETKAQFPYERNANLIAPQAPTIQQLPGNMGQWVIEPTAPSSLVQTKREFVTPDRKQRILGALPANLFQVDHAVPLWAGGADTEQNLQILPTDIHEVKTKVQAVPLTLLANGKIDLNTAKRFALTWKSRDATGIPNLPENGNGLLPLDIAEKAYSQWLDYERRGYDAVPFTQKVKDVFATIPEEMQKFGKGWLPDTVREFLKGGVTGATGNIIPYMPDEDASAVEIGAGTAGNIIGSVWGLGKFSRLVMPAFAKTGWRAFQPAVIKLTDLAEMFPTVAKTSAIQASLARRAGSLSYKAMQGTLQKDIVNNIIRNTAIFSSYGLLSQGAQQTLFSHEEDKINSLGKRLLSDVGLGVLTGGLMNNWRGSIGVGVGTLVLGQMLHEDPKDSLSNAVMMTAFHRWGALNPRRLDTAAISKSFDSEVPRAATNILRWWGGDPPHPGPGSGKIFNSTIATKPAEAPTNRFQQLKESLPKTPQIVTDALRMANTDVLQLTGKRAPAAMEKPVQTSLGMTQNEIFEWTHKALGKLDEFAVVGHKGTELDFRNNMTLEQYNEYRTEILTAGRELYKRTLPPAEREAADIVDFITLSRSMKDKTFLQKGGITVPNEVPLFLEKAGTNVFISDARKPTSTPDESMPTGVMQLRGLGVDSINEDIGNAYIKAKAQGQTSKYVVGVVRPDIEPVVRRWGEAYSQEDIQSGLRAPSKNPQKSVQYYAVTIKDGMPVLSSEIGWQPRERSISADSGYPYALNKQPEIVSGTHPKYDVSFNKDVVTDAAIRNGTPVFIAEVDAANIAKRSGKPFITIKITPETWALSKDIMTGQPVEPTEGVSRAISGLQQNAATSEVVDSIAGLKKRVDAMGIDSATALSQTRVPDAEGNKQFVQSYIELVGKTINGAQTPEQLLAGLRQLGIAANPELASSMLAKRGSVNAKQILNLLKMSVEKGQAGETPTAIYESIIKPFLQNSRGSLRSWGEIPIAPNRPLEAQTPVEIGPKKGGDSIATPGVPAQEQITPTEKASAAPQMEAAASTQQGKEVRAQKFMSSTKVGAPAALATPQQAPAKGRLSEISSRITTRAAKGDIPVKTTMKTKTGVVLNKEVNPDGSFWLEQNVAKDSEWARLAKAGHKVEHLMLPNNQGWGGKVRIDGRIMGYDEARALMRASEGAKPTEGGAIEKATPQTASTQVTPTQPEKAAVKPLSLIDQAPPKADEHSLANNPEYQKAKSGLEQVGLGTGRQIDAQALDEYIDNLIKHVKSYTGPVAIKKQLARDAIKLINTEDLNLRAVSSGRSREAWERGVRDIDINKYINSMRDRIAAEFDVELTRGQGGGIKETKEETIQRVTANVKRDAEKTFAGIDENKRAATNTYNRAWGETWDRLAKGIFGKDYRSNYNFMKMLSDKSKFGKQLWRGTAEEGLMATTRGGEQISQRKDWVVASGRGERSKIPSIYSSRKNELVGAQKARELSRESTGAARSVFDKDSSRVTSIETAGMPMEQGELSYGYRIEDRTQSPHENVQDLTRLESKVFNGLLDEVLHGHDPKLSPTRGMEDAISFFLDKEVGLVRNYNQAVLNKQISGQGVRLADLAQLKREVKTALEGTGKTKTRPKRTISDAEKELIDLKKQIERSQAALEGVTVSSKYRKTLDAMKISNAETIADLRQQLTKTK